MECEDCYCRVTVGSIAPTGMRGCRLALPVAGLRVVLSWAGR